MMLIAESGSRLGYARVKARWGPRESGLKSQDSMVDQKAAGVRTSHCPRRYAGVIAHGGTVRLKLVRKRSANERALCW